MSLFKQQLSGKNEIKECYILVRKLHDFTNTKRPRLRKLYLSRNLGNKPSVILFLENLQLFFRCRATEFSQEKQTMNLYVQCDNRIGELISAISVDLDNQCNGVSPAKVGRICDALTRLKKCSAMSEEVTLDCIVAHRNKAHLAAAFTWSHRQRLLTKLVR